MRGDDFALAPRNTFVHEELSRQSQRLQSRCYSLRLKLHSVENKQQEENEFMSSCKTELTSKNSSPYIFAAMGLLKKLKQNLTSIRILE